MFLPLHLIWTASPEIFSSGIFQFRWFTILLLLGILLARKFYIDQTKKLPSSDIDFSRLFWVVIVVGLIVGRLLHVVFNQSYLFRMRPWQAVFPFEFDGGFRFMGTQGFSALGIFLGMLLASWLFTMRSKVRFAPLAGILVKCFLIVMIFVRLGNLFNGEQYGTPTDSKAGVVFAGTDQRGLMKVPCCVMRTPDGENPLSKVKSVEGNTLIHHQVGYKPVKLYLWFKPGVAEQLVREFLIGDVKAYLFDHKDHFFEPGDDALHYTIFLEEDQTFIGMVQTVGIARHPFQIYEAIVFLILLVVFLRSNWIKNAPYASGLMLVLFSALHFGLDFLREAQNLKWLPLHAEQLMLVPVVVLGILLLVKGSKPKE
ncbi:MAG: prolipoprotein diacylglyceryl transferase [Bacteroidetes bacterium]|nr:prolipoprotein diacylglyceryl transferase [Bacteroidota bacterium]